MKRRLKKCILFGAASTGEVAYRLLKEHYEIIGFVDNDPKKWGQFFCEKEIYDPNKLSSFEDVEMIIASIHYEAIIDQLKELGIRNIKVFYYIGNVQNPISNEYRVYQISDTPLFDACKYDKERAVKIEKDFFQNYSLVQKQEKTVLKKTDRKKVLFCAYIFPPLGGAGVQRSLKFVKYLRKFGYEPIVLTVGINDGKTIEDKRMLEELPDDITVIRIDYDTFLPEAMSNEGQQEIFNLYAGVMQSEVWIEAYKNVLRTSYHKFIPDNRITWVNQCLKEIEQRIDLRYIDIVYTTGSPYSTFFLGYYLKKKYGIKWVADYRDPWMCNDFWIETYYKNDADTIELQQQMEKNLISLCDYVVCAVDIKNEFANKCNLEEDKFVEITNGYDEDDFRNIEITKAKNSKFTLCYNGGLYGNRSPIYLMKMINQLIEENKIGKDSVQWIFNGWLDKKYESQLNSEDVYGVIQYNGYLSHRTSLEIATNADLLILFGVEGTGSAIVYCGKLFEYLRMKKPILSFSTKGGILDEVLQRTNSGTNFDYQDEAGIKEYLLNAYTAWKQGIEVLEPNEEEIRKYSRENLTLRLADIFDSVLRDRKMSE